MSSNPVIILVGGKARNGKGEIAAEMSKCAARDGFKTITVGLADYLKWICYHYAGVPIAGHSEDQRFAWQHFGTDVVRNVDEDHWVREMEFIIRKMKRFQNWDYIFVPDFRFPNECSYFIERGYSVYSIEAIRKGATIQLNKEEASHSSENSVNDFPFDFKVVADNMDDLKRQSDDLWEIIKRNSLQSEDQKEAQ